MPSYLVTGSSRGIGLAIVEYLVTLPDTIVLATARNPGASKGLQDLAAKHGKDRLVLVTLDVSSPASIEAAHKEATALLPKGLDYLVLNAGTHMQPSCTFDDIDFKLLAEEIRFNTEYPIVTIRTFLPLIRKSEIKKIAFISSELGSIEAASQLPGLTNAYCIAKASYNMLARKYGGMLKFEGINVVTIHPGWVKTEIGDGIEAWMNTYAPQMKPITAEVSASGSIKAIQDAKLEEGPGFYNWEGVKRPW
ncbi:hypothetical protein CPB83DRAFT_856451 [Crepidotus variabilis]|uniref:NAD(P)-binding protein n=1 Tax=Crepidotus variabilis TaxID=179855 RepID=A0A9P6EDE2_9AGAR|nr:hypothetical protein CPB83DRAFT_856451 [Crepidotus variabilis]